MATTQIVSRQIKDGAIDNAKIAAGAAIATSKLDDGAEFIQRDGSVAMTGNLDLGSQRIVSVQTPSTGTDAANKDYVDNAIAGLNQLFDNKPSVKVATAAAGTLASSFENGDTVDGIVLTTGDRILIKNQAAPAENGIYIVAASGAPTRAADMNAWAEVPGAFVVVEEGTANADTIWLASADAGGTLNTTAINWQQIPTTAGYTTANFVDNEVPSGSINGSNVTFTIANTPVAGSVHLYINGVRGKVGSGNDYTISGSTITMEYALATGETLLADYRK